jgi:acylphosphatase
VNALHLRIRGRVQGVGYRASMSREARRLGLSGWVRNRLDGSVEAAAVGDDAAIEALIDWAHRGPPAARVTEVEVRPLAGPIDIEGFEQRPTG